jgi:hypothetical protein
MVGRRQHWRLTLVLQSDAIGPPFLSTAEYLTIARLSTGVGRLLCLRSQGLIVRTANGCITSVLATTDVDKLLPNAYNLTTISSDFHPTRWSTPYGQ